MEGQQTLKAALAGLEGKSAVGTMLYERARQALAARGRQPT